MKNEFLKEASYGWLKNRLIILFIHLLSFGIALPIVAQGATVQIPRTGQTTCYNEIGAAIACTDTGQDGDVLAGVMWPSPRFFDNGDGTITDNLTGLIWLKDANCMATHYPAFDTDGTAGDGRVTWQHALDFVTGINRGTYQDCSAGYSDWRLPNIIELESLSNSEYGDISDWLESQGFKNVDSYWSSTAANYSTDFAAYFNSEGGVTFGNKVWDYSVLPVRGITTGPAQLWKTGQTTSYAPNDDGDLQEGIPWPSPRFTDNGNGTITDNLTGLIYLKDANCMATQYPGFDTDETQGDGEVTWQHAFDFVSGINSGRYPNCGAGHTDWHLPNRKELMSLFNYGAGSSASQLWLQNQGFTNVQVYYWSSTTWISHKDEAWADLIGSILYYPKTDGETGHVWPVRVTTISELISAPSTPSGRDVGTIGRVYNYSSEGSVSSLEHPVEYQFDWGDGTYSSWSSSGDASKAWSSSNIYEVRVQGRCATDHTILSPWSTPLIVTISSTPFPDLSGQWTSLTQSCKTTKTTKCKITGTFIVQNIGEKDAVTSFVRFYLSSDATYSDGDTLLKKAATGKIKAGKTKAIKLTNQPLLESASGKYIIAVIDADNTISDRGMEREK